ncbi:MAG: 4-hydroxythreonine-4-phosphate dehydrogenase PdxA, partial [Alphaproteobacteria bacterium]|nr:4-hydroxythreonine-4-phosphate dehydrogenase PdxA [Alphaproteobacteria bacterium]
MKRIAISMGDPAGIGPEIALKAALDPRVTRQCRPLLVGDPKVLAIHAKAAGLSPRVKSFANAASVDWSGDEVRLLSLDLLHGGTVALGTVSAAHGRASLASAKAAID